MIALVAFWPTYLSKVTSSSGYTHLHALTAAIWMMMLVAQPLAIRTRRLGLHRTVGRMSYAAAPLVVVSMLLLAHSKTHGVTGTDLLGFSFRCRLLPFSGYHMPWPYGLGGIWRCTRDSWFAPP